MPQLKSPVLGSEHYVYTVSEHAETQKYVSMYHALKRDFDRLLRDYHTLQEAYDFARQLLLDSLPKNLPLRRVYFDTRIHRFIAEYEAD